MATAVDSRAAHLSCSVSISRTSAGKNGEDQGELDIPLESRDSRNGSRGSNAREESAASYMPSTEMLERHRNDETLVTVKICSSVEESNFCVSVSSIVTRELEMSKTALSFGIEPSRWTKSRLFREWCDQNYNTVDTNADAPMIETLVVLDPENDCISSNQSHSFTWEPWLTTCIRAYYNTGNIRIPDKCLGSDILLALEYFGILYSPEQLVFESFGAYLRVKMWSDYFTHRARIADWVVQRLLTKPSRHSHSFVTSPNMQEELFHLSSNKPIDVLDGDLVVDPSRYGDSPSRAIVHEFFNDEDEGNDDDDNKNMDGLMREDFCSFVQASLPGTNVSFSLKLVTTSREEAVRRAVLRVTLGTKTPLASEDCKTIGLDVTSHHSTEKAMFKMASTPSLNGSLVLSAPTASTQPSTTCTFGDLAVDLPHASLNRTHIIRRCQTEKPSVKRSSILDQVYNEQPCDDFTPIQSQQDASPWRPDDPSVDRPRETLRISNELVRSQSKKMIRKTVADMDVVDTIDNGLSPTSFSGNGAIHKSAKRNLPLALELNKYCDHASVHNDQDEVAPFRPSHRQFKSYQNPPMGHVNINHVRSCDDGTVTSALSNPTTFDEVKCTIDGLSMNHQSSFTTLSDFRTTVDALSAFDEQSLQIEVQEEKTRVERGRSKSRVHKDEEENIYPQTTRVLRDRPKYKMYKAEEDESMDSRCDSGLVGTCYEMFFEPAFKNCGSGKLRKDNVKLRGRKDTPSDGTLRTEDESDENDSHEGQSSYRSNTGPLTYEEAICAIGDMATTLIDAIFENKGVERICHDGKSKRKSPKRRGASKKRNMAFGEDWDGISREIEEEDDDAAAEIISRLSSKIPPTGTIATGDSHSQGRKNSRNPGKKLLPPRPIDNSQNRLPVRTSVPPQARTQMRSRSRVRHEGMEETEFDRIQDILKKAERPHSERISVSVLRNLQLLKESRGPESGDFVDNERVAPVEKKLPNIKIIETGNDRYNARDKNHGGRKGLLGFLRKK